MGQTLRAIYRQGAFIPQVACDLPDGSEVELIIQGPTILAPEVSDPEEREQILRKMIERMRQNPIPADSPRLTRESLHERR
jgi:predicted DNA-binding antitoxin AbrB/MazE fold protein